jgi:HSP20 family molecular chaperone IbpA
MEVEHMSLPIHRTQRTPARWDPFREIGEFYDRMGRLLESTGRDVGSAVPIPWMPPVDLEETEDAYTVEVDLPGVAREDVSIEVNDRELLVTGEIKERKRLGRLHRGRVSPADSSTGWGCPERWMPAGRRQRCLGGCCRSGFRRATTPNRGRSRSPTVAARRAEPPPHREAHHIEVTVWSCFPSPPLTPTAMFIG